MGRRASTVSKKVGAENRAVIEVAPPTASGDSTLTTMPLTWNSGRISRQWWSGPSRNASVVISTMAVRLAWSRTTPFGVPVVPLV